MILPRIRRFYAFTWANVAYPVADPEAVAGGGCRWSGTEVGDRGQRGPGSEPLVGVRGQSRQKRGSGGSTYSDYLTVDLDLMFNFARTCTFYKG